MATRKIITNNSDRKVGDFAVLANGGNVNTASSFSVGLGENTGSKVKLVASTTLGVRKPFSDGVFAFQEAGQYVMMRETEKLSNVSNTTLQSGAGDMGRRRVVNSLETDRYADFGDFSYISGIPLTTPSGFNNSLGSDHAARPTRAIPGEFVILEGGNVPSQKDYSAKHT